jgi:hypothetical protein
MPVVLNDTQLYEEYNRLTSFELCTLAQEIIQDSVNKITEFLSSFKVTSTNSLFGDQNTFLKRKAHIEDIFSTFDTIFQRLRVVGTIVHQRRLASNQAQSYSASTNNNQLELLKKEQADLKKELNQKNIYLKLAIDKIADIIWSINSIQKIRA